ncbi:MAG: hypothetical protein AAB719_01275 [Patescibacteria group bacterium]
MIDYKSTDPRTGKKTHLQTKFIGGTNKEHLNESVDATRDREVMEESSLIFLNSERIWQKDVSSEHTKYGFLVNFEDCWGKLREAPMNDNGDELSAPYWVRAEDLARTLFHSHQEMYMVACRTLGIF